MHLIDAGSPMTGAASVGARFREACGEDATAVGRAPGRSTSSASTPTTTPAAVCPSPFPRHLCGGAAAREAIRLRSAQADDTWEGTADVGPDTPGGRGLCGRGVVVAADVGYEVPGVEVVIDSTVPVGAGLSSRPPSSAWAAVVASLGAH